MQKGGGQPCDTGTLTVLSSDDDHVEDENNDHRRLQFPVVGVFREKGAAVHRLDLPKTGEINMEKALARLQQGAAVRVDVEWKRRFDHMQQHTAQHLLTAVAIRRWGIRTEAWNLGTKQSCKSFLELSSADVTQEMIDELEEDVNAEIRAQRGDPATVLTSDV